jgi:SNF2 family DNA or RNA helicase
MKLDYTPATKFFSLWVPRKGANISDLMNEHGLNFSAPASTPDVACLFTGSQYAAATFMEYGTPAALAKLDWVGREVARSRAASSNRHIEVPDGEELSPFQRADLDYMLDRERVLCADEPGLGKTPIAIAYANEIRAQRVLVVCPAAIRYQWCRRIKQWSTMGTKYAVPNLLVYAITSSRYGVVEDAAWTVVSYELARHPGILAALRKIDFDLGIFDEIHYAKDIGSKRSRALWGGGNDPIYRDGPLADRCRRVVCLSGTPLPNRPREMYSLARHLHWDSIDWLSEEKFRERFNPSEERVVTRKDGSTAVIVDERSGRHSEFQNRLRANFMCRHLKREVLTQLKLPEYDLIMVDETTAVKAALKAESMLDIDPDNLEGANAGVLGHITTARRLMGEAIAPQCADWLKMLIEGGEEKLLLFYWFIENGGIVQKTLEPWLARHGRSMVRIDGSTGAKAKDALVQKFVTDPRCTLAMGNVLSLGTGTDELQHVCSHALIMEPDWVPGNNVQCVDRLDRWGQKHVVQADIFVAPNSIAEKVLASALRKGRVIHDSLDRRV